MEREYCLSEVCRLSREQQGGALVESILIVSVLSIFMVGVPMIGSMIDLKQTTIQASRYSAWEKTVYVDPNGTPNKINERFFRNASAPIAAGASSDLGNNILWGEIERESDQPVPQAADSNGSTVPGDDSELPIFQRARVTIAGPVSVSNDVGEAALGANDTNIVGLPAGEVYRTVGTVVTKLGRVVSPDGWNEGDPVSDGLVRSNVESHILGNSILASGGAIKESTSIFIDGWSAGDDDTIRERVHGFVPSNRLEKVGAFISKVKFLPMLSDLKHLEKAFGCVKNNIVPGKTYQPVSDNPASAGLVTYTPTAGDDC